MEDKILSGCFENQTVTQKEKNYKLEEVCASPAIVEWKEKGENDWRTFPLRNQKSSLTCVAQTLATEMGILFQQKYGEWIDFSASFPYSQRGGTYGGCSSSDIYSIFPKIGNVFENVMPSQNMSESEVIAVVLKNYFKDLALPFCIKRIELPIDFETCASTISATDKGLMTWYHIGANEWGSTPIFNGSSVLSNHSICAIDYGLIGGIKHIRIMDSSGMCFRNISEEYFKARCFLASYLKSFQTLTVTEDTVKPIFDGSIKSAQECLKYLGYFPNINTTNFWGNISRQACIKFQLAYNISPAWGNLGIKTKGKLLELFP